MIPTRPILRYHGGKWKLAPWIISHFPEHRVYVEPFCGAASVLLQKPVSKIEVLNDLYSRIVNCYRVLRDPEQSDRLYELLSLTPYSEVEYKECRCLSSDPVEDARRLIVIGHQAHGSTGASGGKLTGWRRGVRNHGGSSADEWRKLGEHVESWAHRLRGVYLENDTAVNVIERWDAPDALFYVDPPYVAASRTQGLTGYAHEMSDDEHRALAQTLRSVQGMVVMSGYASDLYDELFSDWNRLERKHFADAARERVEVLWLSPNIPLDAYLSFEEAAA